MYKLRLHFECRIDIHLAMLTRAGFIMCLRLLFVFVISNQIIRRNIFHIQTIFCGGRRLLDGKATIAIAMQTGCLERYGYRSYWDGVPISRGE